MLYLFQFYYQLCVSSAFFQHHFTIVQDSPSSQLCNVQRGKITFISIPINFFLVHTLNALINFVITSVEFLMLNCFMHYVP